MRRRRRRLGEQLLELVDHQQQLRAVGRAGPAAPPCGSRPPVVSCSSRLAGGFDRDAQQRRLQLLERMRARAHVGHEPLGGAGQGPAAQGGQQPGVDDARLPAATRADQGDEPAPGAGLAEPCQQPFDEALATEEVGGVGFFEGAQSLVRVAVVAAARPAPSRLHGLHEGRGSGRGHGSEVGVVDTASGRSGTRRRPEPSRGRRVGGHGQTARSSALPVRA